MHGGDYVDIVNQYRDEVGEREYWVGTNYELKMYDKFGIVNEVITIRYIVDAYVSGFRGIPDINMLEWDGEFQSGVIEPTYLYLDNGEKICYTDYFIDYGDGEKIYDLKNPLNLECNKPYVVEVEINGKITKGLISIPEEYKDY